MQDRTLVIVYCKLLKSELVVLKTKVDFKAHPTNLAQQIFCQKCSEALTMILMAFLDFQPPGREVRPFLVKPNMIIASIRRSSKEMMRAKAMDVSGHC